MTNPRWIYVLPGGGPWRILDDCEGKTHNVLSSYTRRKNGTRCVCPRTLALYDEHRVKMAANYRSKAKPKELKLATGPQYGEVYMKDGVGSGNIPDFSKGLCTTKRARAVFDRSRDGRGGTLQKSIASAKAICNSPCPVRGECLAWAGSKQGWEGVYGGMTYGERFQWFLDHPQ